MKLPHINYGTNDEGSLFVSIEDTELFDYIDDYLTEECDIEYDYMIPSENNLISTYKLIFSKNIKEKEIEAALSKLSITEIEKIYSLNN